MCKQLLMYMLEKMGYCSCFRWTTLLHLRNKTNNNDNNDNCNKDNCNNNTNVNSNKYKNTKKKNKKDDGIELKHKNSIPISVPPSSSYEVPGISSQDDVPTTTIGAQIFNYRELATATNNFRSESFLGEGGFGPVYKGKLVSGQLIAVKKLNLSGIQGEKEFLVEVLMLSLLRHRNLVNLIGYCAEGNQRLLVYELMIMGSLAEHLHDLPSDAEPLDWNTRLKIAAGAAEGLNYLHNEADPNVIYRDLKSANILLDNNFHPKLSDFGLAKFGPEGDKSHVSTRVMGTQGYCAPEYAVTGKLTKMSDIFSFGVVLLELVSGQQALNPNRGHGKHLLVNWANPFLKHSETFLHLADPKLQGRFSQTVLCKVVEIAAMCVRENPQSRPGMGEIVLALNYLSSKKYNPNQRRNSEKGDRNRRSQREDNDVNDDIKVYISEEENDLTEVDKEIERKLAVAEAKMWGETWREKKKPTKIENDDKAR